MFEARKQIARLKAQLEEAQERVSAQEGRHSQTLSILESMAEGVIIVEPDTRIVSINPSTEKIFGILKKDTEGKFFLEVIRNSDIADLLSQALKSGESISQEITLSWPIQGIFQINASRLSAQGRIAGCVLVLHDITQIRKLEAMRRDFVANVSHELKTPLTAIKGYVETLLEGAWEDKESCRQFLQIIQEHAQRLDSLINDLLDLSGLESRELALEKKPLAIKRLVDDILAGFHSQLKKKSILAKNDLPVDLVISLDAEKIRQVFTNLIDNAIKFNRQNGSLSIYSQQTARNLKIFVEDSGIGIPPKDIPRIFERFYRVDKARSRSLGGTGLGLAIVKHITELHGGSVGVESTEGLGTKFYLNFTLP